MQVETAEIPGAAGEAFLGVEQSVTGKRWRPRVTESRLALALAQRLDLPEIVARVLAGRGVDIESAPQFLDPSLKQSLPDPSHLLDLDRAVARLLQAIDADEKIAVFGDYDVDGATSAALLVRFFRALGVELRVYVPDRIAEGYGPNAAALRRLRAEEITLVITVDCGTTAQEPLTAAKEAGLDVIVVDHHTAEPQLPPAFAMINPNRLDDTSPHGMLAAVGVTFLLVVALNRELRRSGWYARKGIAEPDLRQWLDLVALGTVCDVVPLKGPNRALVTQGLKIMAGRGNTGLTALADLAGLSEKPGTYHAGYLLGPRINAGGRVGKSDLGARLLATDDAPEAAELARILDGHNQERRIIEAAVLDQALAQIDDGAAAGMGLVFVAGEGWHPGVTGIVASRLKERTNRPALVIALDKGVGRGSGRSVPGLDLGSEVIAARQAGLLLNGGGHAMAAGLTVATEAISELRDFLEPRIKRRLAAIGYQPSLGFDGALQPEAASADLVRLLERVGPFGSGNPEPRFALPSARIAKADVVGDGHVRCAVAGPGSGRLKAIAFRALDSALGQNLLKSRGLPLHLAGKLRLDTWAGPDSVQFIIEDAAPHEV